MTTSPGRRPRVAIIDYEAGNLFSVQHACVSVGLDAVITPDPAALATADAAILPGVGAFGEAMGHLGRLGLVGAIQDFVASGRPFLGVCLGLQLLFTESEEFGLHPGLGLVPGRVVRFPARDPGGALVRVPQIGWNQIHPPGDAVAAWTGTPLEGTLPGEHFYFVHSYFVVPADTADVIATARYGGAAFCAGVRRGNLFAVQFHPEKSAHAGLRLYQRWAENIL
jgi:imidazole glycerol-phosphate synthase subunit HisH